MLRAENSTIADARTEGLALEISRVNDISKALKHWRGLLVLDECDAARKTMPTLLAKLLSTQELRVLCTARSSLNVAGEVLFRTCLLYTSPSPRD